MHDRYRNIGDANAYVATLMKTWLSDHLAVRFLLCLFEV